MWSAVQFLFAKQCELDFTVKSQPTYAPSPKTTEGRPQIEQNIHAVQGLSGMSLNSVIIDLTLSIHRRLDGIWKAENAYDRDTAVIRIIIPNCSRNILRISRRHRRTPRPFENQAMAFELDKNQSCSGTCSPHQGMAHFGGSIDDLAARIYSTTQPRKPDKYNGSEYRFGCTTCACASPLLLLWIAHLQWIFEDAHTHNHDELSFASTGMEREICTKQ